MGNSRDLQRGNSLEETSKVCLAERAAGLMPDYLLIKLLQLCSFIQFNLQANS